MQRPSSQSGRTQLTQGMTSSSSTSSSSSYPPPPSSLSTTALSPSAVSRGVLPPSGTSQSMFSGGGGGGGLTGGTGLSLQTTVEVHTRPVLREGMKAAMPFATGSETAMGPGRTVRDRSYYLGLLRAKILELTTELHNLTNQEEELHRRASFASELHQESQRLQEERTRTQRTLGDYNFALERASSVVGGPSADADALAEECQAYHNQNTLQRKENDQLFVRLKEEEKNVRHVEVQLQHMLAVLDQRIANPEYRSLREENGVLLDSIATTRHELTVLTERHDALLSELNKDPDKHAALLLQKEILKKRRIQEALDRETRVPLEEERLHLLHTVRSTTAEIDTITRQVGETREEMERRREVVRRLEAELKEYHGEHVDKYRELEDKHHELQRFLDGYNEKKSSVEAQAEQIQARIVALLERISQNVKYKDALSKESDAPSRLQSMREELETKEKYTDSSALTHERLLQEFQARKVELDKVASLDGKLAQELASLSERMAEQTAQMDAWSNLDVLRAQIDEKKSRLLTRRASLLQQREVSKLRITAANQSFEKDREALMGRAGSDLGGGNEYHNAIRKQEQRMRVILQTTHQLEDYVRSRERETTYAPIRGEILRLGEVLNNNLKEGLGGGGTQHSASTRRESEGV